MSGVADDDVQCIEKENGRLDAFLFGGFAHETSQPNWGRSP